MNIKNLLSKINNVRFGDILSVFPFLIAIIPAVIFKKRHPDLWIVSERKNEARDNGYWLFRHIRKNYPEIDIVYAINTLSPDYHKVSELGKVIRHGSLVHWIYYLSASKIIKTHKIVGDPNAALCSFLILCGLIKNKFFFLQHGITMNKIPFLDYRETKFLLFVCAAKQEYEYVRNDLHYPEGNVQLLGFCRFDNLYIPETYKKNQILIMPTWRVWLSGKIEQSFKSNFREAEYFIAWNNLLNNTDFIDLLEKYDLYVKFYPHANMQKYLDGIISTNNRIIIADWQHYDVQDLLKESGLLITDYSSIAMDFAYMRKPLIYYQFDQQQFRTKQYQEGYFSYDNDGFGEVVLTLTDLLETVQSYAKTQFAPKDIYLKRIEQFYAFFDNNNCERTYKAIKEKNENRNRPPARKHARRGKSYRGSAQNVFEGGYSPFNHPMTITIDCRWIDSSGVGVHLKECLPFFLDSGNSFFLLGDSKKLAHVVSGRKNAEILECPVKPFSFRELFAFPQYLLKKINYGDLYYSPYFNIPRGIKIPVYTTVHDIIFPDMMKLSSRIGLMARVWFYRRAFDRSKKIFTVSEFSKSRISHYSKNKVPVIVIYNGIQSAVLEYRAAAHAIQKKETIVFVGNIKKHKGLDYLLDAFQQARNAGLPHKLIIIGSKENFRTSDNSILKKIKIIGDVSFTGFVSDKTLMEHLSAASLFVQPSLYEGFCLPPLEALVLGTPALISDIPVLKEIYADYPVTYFRTGNSNDLKEKMLELLLKKENTSPVLSEELLSKYTFEKTASGIMKEFK